MASLATLNTNRKWTLTIFVTDLQLSKKIEVNGQTHVGQVMLDLVDKLDVQTDWSDHGLWWAEVKQWLVKPRVTLATVGITSDTNLDFTPMHKTVKLQLPDLQYLDMRVSFSVNAFNAVKEICTDLGIRHPEELSLLRVPDKEAGGKKRADSKKRKQQAKGHNDTTDSHDGSVNGTLDRSRQQPPSSPMSSGNRSDASYSAGGSDTLNPYSTPLSPMLAHTTKYPSVEALDMIGKGKRLEERSKINCNWLFSSESLMEQGIKEFDLLQLRFKYYNFFDLNPKVDEVRINQVFEQAKWQILTEEVECTEEEAITFAALMFQVRVAAQNPMSTNQTDEVDDIDSALNELQMTLEGTTGNSNNSMPASRPTLTHIPEMKDNLNMIKSKKMGMKSTKQYYFMFKDTHLSYFKGINESNGAPIQKFNLKSCEVAPEVNIVKDKYNIRLKIPGPDVTEIELGCTSPDQYVKWMAACRLASKGKTMADPSYEMEMAGVKTFISMQGDTLSGSKDETDYSTLDSSSLQAEDFVPPRVLSKYKNKQIAARILEAHSSYTKQSLLEAKLNYIRSWQCLPDFGITTFNVIFTGELQRNKTKKKEICGIAFNRLLRMDTRKERIKEWRYSTMKNWNVNWETREMCIANEGETIIFSCEGCDVRVVHEFIGGYIFLTMRKDVNSAIDDEQFYKLTASGWN